MYRPDQFLEFARQYSGMAVSEQTVENVREVSTESSVSAIHRHNSIGAAMRSEQAVYNWLEHRYGEVRRRSSFPDWEVQDGPARVGFEVRFVSARERASRASLFRRLAQTITHPVTDLDKVTIVFVAENLRTAREIVRVLNAYFQEPALLRKNIIAGFMLPLLSGDGFVTLGLSDGAVDFEPDLRDSRDSTARETNVNRLTAKVDEEDESQQDEW